MFGVNDIFEVFTSYKDKKCYIISSNYDNYNLDIYSLDVNKKINSLSADYSRIRCLKYFINDKTHEEYLISSHKNNTIIIWDITENYNIIYKIQTNSEYYIYSCLLVFPNNTIDNYLIAGCYLYTFNKFRYDKLYKQHFTYNYYLLSWLNNKDKEYYIIQFSSSQILICNLIKDEVYANLNFAKENHCGFIYNQNNTDFLCAVTKTGIIYTYNLENKEYVNIMYLKSELHYITEWNDRYIIMADYMRKSIKIMDFKSFKLISNIIGQHTEGIKCIKKIFHPVYGELLLTAGDDNTIKLWDIK